MKGKDDVCIVPRRMLRSYIIVILSEKPLHGYAIIQRIRKHTGFWKPSPGAIYPMLSLMEKDGILSSRREDSKVVYSLTAKGRKIAVRVHEFREHFRKSSLEALSSVISSGDFARMNERLVSKLFGGKPSFGAVNAANAVWVCAAEHFLTRQDESRKDVESLLRETERKLRKMLSE